MAPQKTPQNWMNIMTVNNHPASQSIGGYFRGWKRKAGVVTLVMACVCAAGWVRSLNFSDALLFTVGRPASQNSQHWITVFALMSANTSVIWGSQRIQSSDKTWIDGFDAPK